MAVLTIVTYLCPKGLLKEVFLQKIVDMLQEFVPNTPRKGAYSDKFEEALYGAPNWTLF